MDKDAFKVGLNVSLQIGEKKESVRTHIVGWEPDQYLLVRFPTVREQKMVAKTGDECLVRFLKGDNAYGFATKVMALQFHPAPLLFLAYPDRIEQMAFRKAKRYRTNLEGRLLDPDHRSVSEVLIEDFSLVGCLMRVVGSESRILEPGAVCYISLNLFGAEIENLQCTVRNRLVRNGRQMIGVEFSRKTKSEEETLLRFIDFLERLKPEG